MILKSSRMHPIPTR